MFCTSKNNHTRVARRCALNAIMGLFIAFLLFLSSYHILYYMLAKGRRKHAFSRKWICHGHTEEPSHYGAARVEEMRPESHCARHS